MLISITGNILLYLTVISSLLLIFPLIQIKLRSILFIQASFFPALSFLLLIYAFVASDLSIKNVFLNSSISLPLIYKISASWASHEGSILLWISFFGIINFIYYSLLFNENNSDSKLYQSIFALIQLMLCLVVVLTSNPFECFSFRPELGLGLNPMLQDMALSIHPPILYIGNICFSPLFISVLVVLNNPLITEEVFRFNQKLLNLSMWLLTLGIALGAWWAYRELGWGGYWFFDPVENISLMPWLSGIALHHLFLVYFRDKTHSLQIILFSTISFLLILYGTFIVRSGIISSVHSFAFSPMRGVSIFIICFILTLISGYFFINKKSNIEGVNLNKNISLISIANIFWVLILGSIIISLIYPIYCYLIYDKDVIIDVNYFFTILVPLFIPLLFLSGLAPNFNKLNSITLIFTLILTVLVTHLVHDKIHFNSIFYLIFLGGVFVCLYTFRYIIIKSNYFSTQVNLKSLSLFLGHFGFGLLAVSIILNCSLSTKIDFSGEPGNKVISNKKEITLEDIKLSQNDNYYRQIAIFKIINNDNIVILKPENRLYKVENSLSQEVDIYSYLFHDVYAVISQVKNKNVSATIYFQPFISFIWLSLLLISMSFIIPRNK